MNSYKILNQQIFSNGEYSIVPIRYIDRYDIMKWRNEQIYHLRQKNKLTKKQQDDYFDEVVSKIFDNDFPDQILFSFLKKDICVGYGGIVHINWTDKNAEVSFVIKTEEEQSNFQYYWSLYLGLLEKVAFQDIKLHKLFVYAFDLRPHLYHAIEKNGYTKEATLKEHCYFEEKYIDVIIHSKINER